MSQLQKIQSRAGFVAKTRLASKYKDHPIGTKCFVNLLRSAQIPSPTTTIDEDTVGDVLMKIANEQWETPVVCLPVTSIDTDKKGQLSLVFNCCMSEVLFQWCLSNQTIMITVATWALQVLEYGLQVRFDDVPPSFPKMKCKGELITEAEVDLSPTDEPMESIEQEIEQDQSGELIELRLPNSGMRNLLIEEVDDRDSRPKVELVGAETGSKPSRPNAEPELEISFQFVELDESMTREGFKRRYAVEYSRPIDLELVHDSKMAEVQVVNSKTGKSVLKIPVSETVSELRSFQVDKERRLYIFLK
ncbi:unnamed protein product [Kuraishia capsulata CBS 1993]|uniref:PIH1 N-terminal domain-containing protein n=1 Tax=Kuraishia capsulata CBS 1993 TaxID=1382522 RepID=W6MGK3_9ASCO|nr:uncharacterized protein KUCA_T00001226001 [Kuraishia capsulata CBS 1993]CDK25259.1 unnamed protein product [Kuraishia capsulata CBS 1993]